MFLGEDEGVTHLQHREGEGEEAAGDEVGGNERERNFDQRFEGRAAEVLGGFFEGFARLLEASNGGAHDVGEAADGVGDDEQNRGIADGVEEREEFSFL